MDHRARQRYRRILWTAAAGGMSRFAQVIVILVSVPLTLNYLGAERYGLWVTVTSIMAMLGFCDFGLGSGILNAITRARATGSDELLRAIVSSGLSGLILISLGLGTLFFIAYPWVNWAAVYGVTSSSAAADAGPLTALLVATFLAGLPLALVRHVQFGLQEGFRSNAWDGFGSVLSLALIVSTVMLKLDLIWLAMAVAISPIVARLMNALTYLIQGRRWLSPHWRSVDFALMLRLIRFGQLFFVIQVSALIAYQSDNLIVANILGSNQVPQYSVPLQLFMIPSIFTGLILMGLWPAYGDALARGEIDWIRRAFATTMTYLLWGSILFSVVLYFIAPVVITAWVGPTITPSRQLLLGMSIWSTMSVVGSTLSTVLNGLHVVRFQVITVTLMALSNIALSIYLVHRIGVSGAIYGTIISYTIFALLPTAIYVPKLLKRLSSDRVDTRISTVEPRSGN